jgi:hypothetical protein
MTITLLALFLIQAGAQNSGTVTGGVHSAAAPAVGVRVYAQQVRDTGDVNSPAAPIEGQTLTEASGRYRLELPAGHYYIASGSVSSPTYYPGTTNLSVAKLVEVTPGGVIDGIDFDSFVAAVSAPTLTLLPSGTLTGTVRFTDGTPAAGVTVLGVPSSAIVPAGAVPPPYPLPSTQTDATGRYRLLATQPDDYYIVAGFAEASAFYTGGKNATTPKTVPLAIQATVDFLDVEIPRPIQRVGTTVRGQVSTRDGLPIAGSTVLIVRPSPAAMGVPGATLPSAYVVPEAVSGADGTFEFSHVVSGFYNARASLGAVHQYQSFDLQHDGSFEVPGVPPGTYSVETEGILHVIQATIPEGDAARLEVVIGLGRASSPVRIEIPQRR